MKAKCKFYSSIYAREASCSEQLRALPSPRYHEKLYLMKKLKKTSPLEFLTNLLLFSQFLFFPPQLIIYFPKAFGFALLAQLQKLYHSSTHILFYITLAAFTLSSLSPHSLSLSKPPLFVSLSSLESQLQR